jgi:hypothetical protein
MFLDSQRSDITFLKTVCRFEFDIVRNKRVFFSLPKSRAASKSAARPNAPPAPLSTPSQAQPI